MIWTLAMACGQNEEPVPAATLEWVSPRDGDTTAAGDVACSVAANGFTLSDPAKHNEGQPIGYIEVRIDDAVVLQTGATTFALSLEPGNHTLSAQLFLDDGDEVVTDDEYTCDEDDKTCEPVVASIDLTVE